MLGCRSILSLEYDIQSSYILHSGLIEFARCHLSRNLNGKMHKKLNNNIEDANTVN